MKGTVKFFNGMKGFGFIAGEDGKEYFVHKSDLNAGTVITDDDAVTFDVAQGDRGPKAANVSLASAEAPAEEAAEDVSEAAPAEEATEDVSEEAPAEEATEEAAEEAEDAPAEATEDETPAAE